MGILKYPRFGQRIAPSTLQCVLAAAPPSTLFSHSSYGKLADLDERVWQLLPQDKCKVLGNCVVEEVKRNLNQIPWEVKFGTLSLISRKIPLHELDVELRTFNALKRRFGQNIPPETIIRDLLNISNFGVRSLVDFLTAVESYASRPSASKQLELTALNEAHEEPAPEGLPSKIEVEISRYPRPGHRIAPSALKDVLSIPVNDRRMARTLLCDLDESSWDNYSPTLCHKLALAVIKQTHASKAALSKQGGRIKIPVPKTNGKPILLQLEQRTFNCLTSRGLLDDPSRLAKMTIADLCTMSGFGAKSLVDLFASLETLISEAFVANSEVLKIAQQLYRLQGAEELRIDDPRFGLALQALRIPGENLKEIAGAILGGLSCPMPAKVFARRLFDLRECLHSARRLKLEDELLALLDFEAKPRNREFTARLLGWDGKGGEKLEKIGQEFGMTREGVRQVSKKHIEYLSDKKPFLPILQRVIEMVAANSPCAESKISTVLLEEKLTKRAFNISGVFAAAEATGRLCPFVIERGDKQRYVVPQDATQIVKQVLQVAKRAVSHWGVTTIEEVAAEVSALLKRSVEGAFVSAVLIAQPNFSWLDESAGWFWIKFTSRNVLLNQIEKILSVCRQIHVTELRSGVSRHHRREGFAPPQRVLLELCAQAGVYRVEGNYVSAVSPIDHTNILGETERLFVAIFRETGPLVELHRLARECISRGMNRTTFMINLSYSPIISRFAKCVYGLRGTEISPGQAESIFVEPKKTRVLSDYGWTNDGKVFLSYTLSKGTLANGIVSVPSGLKGHLQGTYKLHVAEGASIGQIVVRDCQAWGLGPLFRRRGGDPGDSLRILFNLTSKTALVELGQASKEEIDETTDFAPDTANGGHNQ